MFKPAYSTALEKRPDEHLIFVTTRLSFGNSNITDNFSIVKPEQINREIIRRFSITDR